MKQPCRWLGRSLLVLLLSQLACIVVVKGQIFSYSNPYEMPILMNPSLVGNSEYMRLGIVGQSQWMSLKSPFNNYGVAYDMHFGLYDNHNMGISLTNDVQGAHVMQLTALNVYYAYMLDITYEFRMRIGASVGVMMKSTNYQKLTFSDQLGPSPAQVYYKNGQAFSPDFALGVSCEFRDWSFGGAVHHVAEPSFEQAGRDYLRVKRKATLHAMYRYNVFHIYRFKRPLYITPFIVAMQQMRHVQIATGLGVEYIGVKATLFLKEDLLYGQHNIYATLGWDGEYFGALYTYGINLISKGPRGLDASVHELTLHLNFPYPRGWNMFSTYRKGGGRRYARYSRTRTGAARSRRYRR